ncbi:ester cyclase [Flavobacterium sp. ZB4R12]|uniref:ester cyclase n=1 Tax=Flavobacterium sp. ZB4R12 TaxID=3398732 RepID=UPI003AAE1F26
MHKYSRREFISAINKSSGKFYVPGQIEPLQGQKGYLTIIAMMRSGFPDIQWTIEDMITENDKVAVRFTMKGTHQGAFFGTSD